MAASRVTGSFSSADKRGYRCLGAGRLTKGRRLSFASSDDVQQQHPKQLKLMAERQMNIRPLCSALILGVMLAIAGPPIQSMSQSTDQGVSASKRVSQNTNPQKHRYWRHRGGQHPHFGSRRVRTQTPATTARPSAN